MSLTSSEMTPADIRACTCGNDGFGGGFGGEGWWIILLFLFAGWGGRGFGGYSEASDWMGEGRMYGVSYGDGVSYARGRRGHLRGRNVRRDSMGRYSRDGAMMHDGHHDGYHDGYSRDGAKDHMIDKLEDMMGMATTDEERKAIRHCISQIENA